MADGDFASERQEMVAEQLRRRGIADQRVLDAMARVPREEFVFPDDCKRAYSDTPLAIGFGQTISQPYMVALICETAAVGEGDKVLDIGTGSGYQAAVLREMGARVHTIERIPELAATARERLEAAGYDDVVVHVGDGSLGLPDEAPFAGIVVAAAAPELPLTLYEQLVPQGRLVAPVGGREGQRLDRLRSVGRPQLLRDALRLVRRTG